MHALRTLHVKPRRNRGNQRGVSLLEILISILVLGLGVLALISLQLISKRNVADADARSLAAQASYDMLERMRANATVKSTYLTAAGAGAIGRGQQGAEPSPDCRTASCTASQMAARDVWQFEQNLDGSAEKVGGTATGGLVNATACITGPGTAGIYTIAVVWRSRVPLQDSGTTYTACGNDLVAGTTWLYGSADECATAFGKSLPGAAADADCFRRVSVIQAYLF